jgi:hypothetical protein
MAGRSATIDGRIDFDEKNGNGTFEPSHARVGTFRSGRRNGPPVEQKTLGRLNTPAGIRERTVRRVISEISPKTKESNLLR